MNKFVSSNINKSGHGCKWVLQTVSPYTKLTCNIMNSFDCCSSSYIQAIKNLLENGALHNIVLDKRNVQYTILNELLGIKKYIIFISSYIIH